MYRRSLAHRAAGLLAILALVLHALTPLAAAARPSDSAGLHDLCTSTPGTPAPDGDSKTAHCALCVQTAAISGSPTVLPVLAFAFEVQSFKPRPAFVRSIQAPSSRAPPAGA